MERRDQRETMWREGNEKGEGKGWEKIEDGSGTWAEAPTWKKLEFSQREPTLNRLEFCEVIRGDLLTTDPLALTTTETKTF